MRSSLLAMSARDCTHLRCCCWFILDDSPYAPTRARLSPHEPDKVNAHAYNVSLRTKISIRCGADDIRIDLIVPMRAMRTKWRGV